MNHFRHFFILFNGTPILLVKVVWDFLLEIIWLLKILIIYLHHKQTINNSHYEEIYIKNIH